MQTKTLYKPGLNDIEPTAISTVYMKGQGWREKLQIIANVLEEFKIPIVAFALRYAIACFEGMRSTMVKRVIHVFRLEDHYERFVSSCIASGIPPVPKELFIEAIQMAITQNIGILENLKDDEFLYIDPRVFASTARMGLPNNAEFIFCVSVCVEKYIPSGTLRVYTELEKQFTHVGGNGQYKMAANYANRFAIEEKARENGYGNVLWTRQTGWDEATTEWLHRLILELGTMNIFIVRNGKLITPLLDKSFLAGINRRTYIEIAAMNNDPVIEKKIPAWEFFESLKAGLYETVYGCGTAAGQRIAIQSISMAGFDFTLPTVCEVVEFYNQEIQKAYRGEKYDMTYII